MEVKLICLDMLSSETLDLDISKTDFSTVQKSSLDSLDHPKNPDFSISVAISTVQKQTSRLSRKSRQFEKGHLNVSRHLDLDLNCSQLLRPPGLQISNVDYAQK
jgi:hypothetical protein